MRHQFHCHRNVKTVGGRKPRPVAFDIFRDFIFYGISHGNREKCEQNDDNYRRTQKPVFTLPYGELHCFFGQTRKTEPVVVDKETVQ